MFQSLLIKFSKNQGLWAWAVVNEKGMCFLEKPAGKPYGRAARYILNSRESMNPSTRSFLPCNFFKGSC